MRIGNLLQIATALGVAAALVWLAGAPAAASAGQTVLTPLPPTEQEPGKPVVVAARLTDATTGRPVGNATVEFFVMTEVFGQRLMSIGQAVTDTTGRAAVSYKPSWEGETEVVAKFSGNAQYAAAEAGYTFVAIGPVPVHQNAKFGLEPIRAWAPLVVAVLVLAVWATLIGVVAQTVFGMSPRTVPERAIRRAAGRQVQAAGQDFIDGAS